MNNEDLKTYWDQEMYSKRKKIWGMEPSNVAKSAVSFVGIENLKGKRILDIGCGYGKDTKYFNTLSANAFGIDFSDEAINMALQHLPKDIVFTVGDVLDIPYSKDYFDLCFCNCVIHWFSHKNIRKAISEAYRILKKTGLLFLVYLNLITRK